MRYRHSPLDITVIGGLDSLDFETLGQSPYDIEVIAGPGAGSVLSEVSRGFAGLPLRSKDSVRQAQQALLKQYGGTGGFVGKYLSNNGRNKPDDGNFGKRTYNALTWSLGPGWVEMTDADILHKLGSNPEPIHRNDGPPLPEHMERIQRALGVGVDGKWGGDTHTALVRRYPDWLTTQWTQIVEILEGRAAPPRPQPAPPAPLPSLPSSALPTLPGTRTAPPAFFKGMPDRPDKRAQRPFPRPGQPGFPPGPNVSRESIRDHKDALRYALTGHFLATEQVNAADAAGDATLSRLWGQVLALYDNPIDALAQWEATAPSKSRDEVRAALREYVARLRLADWARHTVTTSGDRAVLDEPIRFVRLREVGTEVSRPTCAAGETLVDGKCVKRAAPPSPNGKKDEPGPKPKKKDKPPKKDEPVPAPTCGPGEELVDGACVKRGRVEPQQAGMGWGVWAGLAALLAAVFMGGGKSKGSGAEDFQRACEDGDDFA